MASLIYSAARCNSKNHESKLNSVITLLARQQGTHNNMHPAVHQSSTQNTEFIESLVNVVILAVILMRNFNFHAVFGFQFQSDLKVNANSNMHWT